MKNKISLNKLYWSSPKRRSLSSSSDLRLFYEAIEFIDKYELVSKKQIKQELSVRVKGLKLIQNLSDTGLENLIKELKLFKWIISDRPNLSDKSENNIYRLTKEGMQALNIYKTNNKEFLKILITKMHKEYVIPGWFIDRLWRLNPDGQGQLIIPTPIKSWKPNSINNDFYEWNNELIEQVTKSYDVIKKVSPNSFNVNKDLWVSTVEKSWKRLSELKARKLSKNQKFAPRNRLTIAMKEAAIQLFFGNELLNSKRNDFNSNNSPLATRTYMAWCPRLEELELISYTDYNPIIPGRIIFPVSVFKDNFDENKFQSINDIKNLEGDVLCLHKPIWKEVRKEFLSVIYNVYQFYYIKNKTLYVSIQSVRDETCRQLRISANSFEEYMSKLLNDSIENKIELIISLETDVREDQRQASQLERKPVRINGKFTTLIAITKTKL